MALGPDERAWSFATEDFSHRGSVSARPADTVPEEELVEISDVSAVDSDVFHMA